MDGVQGRPGDGPHARWTVDWTVDLEQGTCATCLGGATAYVSAVLDRGTGQCKSEKSASENAARGKTREDEIVGKAAGDGHPHFFFESPSLWTVGCR